jgi:hypothetical protein
LAELEESIVGCDGQAYIEPCPGWLVQHP